MIYIVTAIYPEAKPLIEYYNLKKEINNNEFQVFKNERINLIISGVNKINSAIATAYLLSDRRKFETDVIINIGVCGTNDNKLSVGDLLYINKVVDNDTLRNYYPDILFRHKFIESSIETFSTVVTNKDCMHEPICDMESSGFYISASKFLSPHQIMLIKVISDRIGEKVDKSQISEIIKTHIPNINKYISQVYNYLINNNIKIDINKIELLNDSLNLTVSQKNILIDKYRKYILRNNREPDIEKYNQVKVVTKDERKKYFNKLVQLLSE